MAEDDTAPDQPKSDPRAGAPEHKGTFLPLIFGGAVAAALGFFGSQIESVERALGLAPPDDGLPEVVDAQDARIAAQAKEIAALTQQIQAIPEPLPPADLSSLESQMSEQSAQIDDLARQVEDLAQRVEEVEKRPMTDSVSRDAIAAYEEELARLQASVEEQRADLQARVAAQRQEIETILQEARSSESDAEAKAQLALARAVAARIITAVDNGAPFAEDLNALRDATDAEVPAVLTDAAAEGVATLGALQSRFPSVARTALSAARSEAASAGEGSFGAFLQRQLGARSVTPQEGNDPDAVLSRAEAAVMQGRLGDTLSELGALPEPARNAIGDWMADAETRHDAINAAQELMSALGTN